MKNKIKQIAAAGVFCAFAFVLTNIGNIIPIRFAGFLSFDPKDAMIVMAGFAIGPWAAVGITLACAFLELITISTTGIIGFIMNVLSSLCFALIPAILYKKNRMFKSAIIGLAISSVLTVVVMLAWNALITPIYMKVPRQAVLDMLLPVFLPFNLIKCLLNTAIVLLLYKRIMSVLRKIKLISNQKSDVAKVEDEKNDDDKKDDGESIDVCAVSADESIIYEYKAKPVSIYKGCFMRCVIFVACNENQENQEKEIG